MRDHELAKQAWIDTTRIDNALTQAEQASCFLSKRASRRPEGPFSQRPAHNTAVLFLSSVLDLEDRKA